MDLTSNINIKVAILLLVSLFYNPVKAQSDRDLLAYADPRIGTAHSRWFYFTPGAVPFGMAKPAPSTNGSYGNKSGWEAVGYDQRHTSIEGFANFHEFQIGGIVFAPSIGKLQTLAGSLEHPETGYRSTFDHKDEIAMPGYYAVLLKDYNIKAELTSTKRVAFHRYTFPKSKQANVIFDIGHQQGESGEVSESKVYLTPDGKIEGYVITRPVYVQKYQPGADVKMYFSAIASEKPIAFGTFNGENISNGAKSTSGKGAGLYLTFSTNEKESITLKAGLSYTSIENARLNLKQEAALLSFDQAKEQALNTWANYLGRIRVTSANKKDLTKFYTGLYHALSGRGLASDVNGAYPKNDGGIGQIPLDKNHIPLHNHYNTDAIWGAFWNLTQLWAIAYPEYYSDWVKSQLLVYKDSGWLSDGIANSRYVSGVGTNFVSLAMASAYAAGIRDFDIKTAYEAALKNELGFKNRPFGAGKPDLERFLKYGYVNHLDSGTGADENWKFSASHTLEYAFSCYAVGQWAKQLNKTADYKQLSTLSNAWKTIFDPTSKFIRPKNELGKFISDFNPKAAWRGFQEGNAWQYTFYVPQNPMGLIAAIGKDNFNTRLDSIFMVSEKNKFGGGTTIDAFSGLESLYNHGNQPNLHISWLFNYAEKPSLTQKWVRKILDDFYGTEGIHGYGYGQDEDQGQLGAWYVMASMGIFDVKGFTDATPEIGLSAPVFNTIRIKGNKKYFSGKDFEIETTNHKGESSYVESFSLNGKLLKTPFMKLKDIQNGGKLLIQLGKTPKDEY
ncbi:GH92 family glycosyl hydrolase [Pedobacter miscanthi]|uniref:GH92 family glycosyl hydrolase n=1 Tax=Pedobacter miscanthi TaxID=2259170 RepID=UPI00292F6E07|nr:GH92 family glycosyl hydrolase [Pedobacter miscanthi]